MSEFKSKLDVELVSDSDNVWRLRSPLIYQSDLIGPVTVPVDFFTDLASVPRVPVVYWFWGGRAHCESVLHDYLYRQNSKPLVSFSTANRVFLGAMESRGKPWYVRWPMYLGVCAGRAAYHQKKTDWQP